MPDKEKYFDTTRADSQSNSHWLPWLQQQLVLKGVLAQTPELPEPYSPDYKKWREVFEQFKIDRDTMLVGHSCGAGFLVRWLSENKIQVGKVALVGPWLDPHHTAPNKFFDFTLDPELLARTQGLSAFYSTDDGEEVLTSVEMLKAAIPALEEKKFSGRGHFTLSDMGTREFPELLEWLT
jgi:predicted alpha/beta hydrolase family esterase